MALKIIPSAIVQGYCTAVAHSEDDNLAHLKKIFRDELPSPTTLDQKMKLWYSKWQNCMYREDVHVCIYFSQISIFFA